MCLAVPGKIVSIDGEDSLLRMADVSFGGARRQVHLCYVPEAREGDYVLVHVGFAISLIDEEEAHRVFEYLREMGDLDEIGDAGP